MALWRAPWGALSLIVALGLIASQGAARAQTPAWPTRPITMVVSNGAGSSPDVLARLLASRMEPLLGQPVIVEDKPGAGNVIGAMNVARAAPDGYRLFFATSAALAANPFMLKNLPYDPVKDFEPIALLNRTHQYLLVHRDVPAHNMAELIALDRKAPGALSFAIDGPRNLAGVTAQAFNHRAETKFVLVTYPNIMNGVQDVMAGRIQIGVFPVAITEGAVREGVLRPLAVASTKRMNGKPDIPAVSELLPNFDFSGWFIVMAPKGTPAEIIAKLNEVLDKAMRDPQVVAMGPTLGYDYDPAGIGPPAKAAAFLDGQLKYWRRVTSELAIEPE